MSAIRSLLRVMTLRDAEAIILEGGKVPTLRRRGQIEQLAMGAIEAPLLAEFVAPLVEGRSLAEGPLSVPFHDPDGGSFVCTVERAAAGFRVVARKGKPVTATPTAARPPPPPPNPAPARVVHAVPSTEPITDADGARARLAAILAPAIAQARQLGASDVFVSSGQPVRMRIDGRLETCDVVIDDGELATCAAALGNNADASLEVNGTRLRVNTFEHLGGHAIAARLIRERVPGLGELGLPGELASIVELRDGLVVVCGTTGSGKSTTLAALVDLLDQRRSAHVITLEDPIEYRFAGRRCLVHQREVGTHVPDFATGLRAALREAPDVIMLGELRDRPTIAAALTAAETGHLVLATLHAPNAAGAIDRMIDAFPEGQQRQIRWQLAAVLKTLVTQFLLPKRQGGRVPAVELVPVTAAVANIIRKGDLHTLPTAIQSGREHGMIPLERSLARLVEDGTVSAAVVKKIAADQDLLSALAPKLR